MGKLDTQSTVTLILNGEQTKTSLRDVTQAVNATKAALDRMRQADDPKGYQEKIDLLGKLKNAQAKLRQETMSGAETNKGFFADYKKGFSEIEEIAGRVTAGTLIYKGISAGLEGIKDLFAGSIEAYNEAQKTQTQLQQALKSTGGVAGETREQLEKYQKALMDQTGVDDDVIAKGEEMLLTFTNVRGKIYEQALPAIVDMTAAMNQGAVSMEGIQKTSIQIGKALNDPIKGMTALNKVGVTFTAAQKDQITTLQKSGDVMGAQSIILKELQKEFGGTAQAIADTDVGALQKFETRIGNIKESIGSFLTQLKGAQASALDPFISWIEKATTTKLSQTFENDRVSLLGETLQLESSNLKHGDRVKLIDQLKEKYPEYLGDIDAEKVSNANLLPILDKINSALVLRIAFQKKSEGLQEAMQSEADAMLRSDNAAQSLAKSIANIQEKLKTNGINFIMPKNLTDLQQAEAIIKVLHNNENNGLNFDVKLGAHDIATAELNLKQLQASYKSAGDIREKFLADQQRFSKQYNFNEDGDDAAQAKYKKDHPVKNPTSGPSAAEQSAAAKKLEEYNKQLQEVRDQTDQLAEAARKGTVDDLDAQLKVIQDKYNKVVEKIKTLIKDPHTTAAIRKELTNNINVLNSDEKLDEQNTKAAFDKAQQEKAKKKKADDLKTGSDRINGVYASAQGELDDQEAADLSKVTGPDPETIEANRLAIQQTYAEKKYELEQKNLEDLKTLYKSYGEDTGKLDKKIADNTIKENDRAAKEKEAKDKAYVAAKQQLSKMELDTLQQGAQLLESMLNKRSLAYKAALIVDKAVAIADVVVSTEVAIAKFAASVALLGPIGAGMASAYGIAAHISEGISIAAIIKSTADGLSGSSSSSSSTTKMKKGGLIVDGPSHDQGGVNLVDNNTGRTLAEVEGGEAFMALSRETTRNNGMLINELLYNSQYRNGAPVSINTALATTPASGKYANGGIIPGTSGRSAGPSNTPGAPADYSELIAINKQLLTHFQEFSKKPWEFNDRAYQDYKNKKQVIMDRATT